LSKPDYDDDHMQKEVEDVAHVWDRIKLKLQKFTAFAEFATHSLGTS
jgi:hypothetical protein